MAEKKSARKEAKATPAAEEKPSAATSPKLGVGMFFLFAVIFVVLFAVIALTSRPDPNTLNFKSQASVDFVKTWNLALAAIGIVFGVVFFVCALIVGGIIRLVGFGNTKTRSIALLIGMLPDFFIGLQLAYFEKWWTDVARIAIPYVGYPLFTTSWVLMVVIVMYGVIGFVRKK